MGGAMGNETVADGPGDWQSDSLSSCRHRLNPDRLTLIGNRSCRNAGLPVSDARNTAPSRMHVRNAPGPLSSRPHPNALDPRALDPIA
eukprot:9498385-Pyramimonas_sp.AAC.1